MLFRSLAFLLCQQGEMSSALAQMQHAMNLLPAPSRAYAEEYLLMLIDAGRSEEAYAFYAGLPESLQKGERMSLTATLAALEMGDNDYLDKQFARTFAVYKEGERRFTDAWFKRETLREAERLGVPYSETFEQEIRRTRALPENIDYRMAREE